MESLAGFIRRHALTTKDAFLQQFPHPFLVSKQKPASDENLFPGSWVIPLKKPGIGLRNSVSLGRKADQDIQIDDDSVSKEHCYFQFSADSVHVIDSNSTNGTTLNGRKLAPHAQNGLASGFRLVLGGKIEFFFFSPSDLYDSLLARAAEKMKS